MAKREVKEPRGSRAARRQNGRGSDGNGNDDGTGNGGNGRPGAPSSDLRAGLARIDTRTKRLLGRLQPGDVAIVDHEDLDRLAAEGLVRCRPVAVVNSARFISGRYPNMGPLLLAAAGITLIDEAGPEVMTAVQEGQLVEVEGAELRVGGETLVKGNRHTLESLEAQLEASKLAVSDELERFAENTLAYLRREHHLLTDSPALPALTVELAGRHVLVVVRGQDYQDDLRALRSYIHELKPVLIGVDGGADALIECGHRPDIIIGDFDSVSDQALRAGAELVVHAYPGGEAPGATRLKELDLPYVLFEAAGTSEDLALLLAYEKRAELLVAVGTHASMAEFLDKGREGMASTFLVRLKVGPILVDAKGVNRLYQNRVRRGDLLLLVAAALFAMITMVAVAQPLHVFFRAIWLSLQDSYRAIFGAVL